MSRCTPIECVDDTVVVLWWWHLVVSRLKVGTNFYLCFIGLRGFEPVRDEGLICPAQKGRDLAENGKFFLEKMKRR